MKQSESPDQKPSRKILAVVMAAALTFAAIKFRRRPVENARIPGA